MTTKKKIRPMNEVVANMIAVEVALNHLPQECAKEGYYLLGGAANEIATVIYEILLHSTNRR